MGQNILENQHGVQVIVAIAFFQTVQQCSDWSGIIVNCHDPLAGGENGILFAPDPGPVDFLLLILTNTLDGLLNLLLLRIQVNQFVQGEMIELCQLFGLPDVGEGLVCFP